MKDFCFILGTIGSREGSDVPCFPMGPEFPLLPLRPLGPLLHSHLPSVPVGVQVDSVSRPGNFPSPGPGRTPPEYPGPTTYETPAPVARLRAHHVPDNCVATREDLVAVTWGSSVSSFPHGPRAPGGPPTYTDPLRCHPTRTLRPTTPTPYDLLRPSHPPPPSLKTPRAVDPPGPPPSTASGPGPPPVPSSRLGSLCRPGVPPRVDPTGGPGGHTLRGRRECRGSDLLLPDPSLPGPSPPELLPVPGPPPPTESSPSCHPRSGSLEEMRQRACPWGSCGSWRTRPAFTPRHL